MNGIDNLTGRIISDAKAFEAETREGAEKSCTQLREDAEKKAASLLEASAAQTAKSVESITARAESNAGMERRSIILKMKNELIAEAFERAGSILLSFPDDEYAELLRRLLLTSALERIAFEREALGYGDEDYESFDSFELILNKKDRERCGARLIDMCREQLEREGKGLLLSEATADIDGGFILKSGSIETNCSFEMIMAEQRSRLDGKVCTILFG